MRISLRTRTVLWSLFLATAAVRMGYGAIIPVLPVYVRQHGLSTFMIAIMTNAYLLSNTVFQSIAGRLSDRWGRRPLLVAGTLLYTAAAALFMIDAGPWYYILLRVLEGMGASAFGPTVRAYIADLVPPEERGRTYGLLSAFDMAGLLFGPLVGGMAESLAGPVGPFAICAVLGLAASLPLWLVGTPPGMAAGGGEDSPAMAEAKTLTILRSRAFLSVALPQLGFAYLNGLYSVIWSLYMQRVGATLWQINLSYTLFAAPLVLLAVPFGTLADRLGRPWLVGIGGACSAVATIGYGFLPYPNALMALCVVDGVASAMVSPASQAFMADVTPVAIRGRFTGLVGSVGTGATIVAATAIGYLYDRISAAWLFIGGALALVVGTATAVWLMARYSVRDMQAEMADQ